MIFPIGPHHSYLAIMLLLVGLYSTFLTSRFAFAIGIPLHVAYFVAWVVSPMAGQRFSAPCLLAWGLAGLAIVIRLAILNTEDDEIATRTPALQVQAQHSVASASSDR